MNLTKKQVKEFEKIIKPVLQFLNNNCHPHTQVIITPAGAEIVEGVYFTGPILDYIKD